MLYFNIVTCMRCAWTGGFKGISREGGVDGDPFMIFM